MIYEVEHSEYTPAGAGRLELLLRGRAWAPTACRTAPPTLLATTATGTRRFTAAQRSPDVAADPSAWTPFTFRFVIDGRLAAEEPQFALEPGAVVEPPAGPTTPPPPPPRPSHAAPDAAPPALAGALRSLESAEADLAAVADELALLEAQVARIVAERRARGAADEQRAAHAVSVEAEHVRLRSEIAGLQAQLLTREARQTSAPAPTAAAPPATPAPPVPPAPAPATPPPGPGPTADAPGTPSPVPRPSRRRLRPTLPAAVFLVGTLALTDAVLTVVWKEPISALYQSRQQAGLSDDLERLDVQLANVQVQLPDIPSPQERMAALADRLDRDARAGDALGRLRIPKLDKSFVFVHGTGEEELRTGPGRYSTGPLPGGRGTVGIAGHRTTYGAPFRDVDQLGRGDVLRVEMPYGDFEYRVEGTRIVKPSETGVLRTVRRDRLVLTACHPLYSAAERIIVIAELRRATPRGPALELGTRAATARRGDAAA